MNQRQADFVSGISHEIKTALTLIRLYGDTLISGNDCPDQTHREYPQIITRETKRLMHLVNNVLDFSRIEHGLKRYSFEVADISKIIAEAVAAYTQHLRRSGFVLELAIDTDLFPVRFDPEALKEVISNLLDNATKYAGETKSISGGKSRARGFQNCEGSHWRPRSDHSDDSESRLGSLGM